MADPFLTPSGAHGRPVHRWSPPEFPDVPLYTPEQVPETNRGDVRTLEEPMPVWVRVKYAEIGALRTHGVAVAASELVVLVQTTWQVRLQEIWARRDRVSHRRLRSRSDRSAATADS